MIIIYLTFKKMIVEDLIMEKCLGKGAYGEVYLTRKKGTETKFATKRIDKRIANSEKYQKYFQNEREILKELDHKNILKLIEIKENSRFYFLVKEYCNGGSLRNCLKRYQEEYDKPFSQEIIQHIMRQLVDAIKYLHSIDIIHRNIKLENILVVFDSEEDKNDLNMLKSTIKLNDFFFATRKTVSSHQTIVGSPYNMDPIILEILKAKDKPCMNLGYDEKADIWSLGSIFYEMLIGKTVFNSDDLESLIREAENGQYTLPFSTPKEILSFINGMLQYDTEDRLSAEELSKHEYLNKNVKDFKRIDISKLRSNVGKNGLIIDFKKHDIIYETFNTKNNYDDDNNKMNNNNENINYSLKNEGNNIQSDSQILNENKSLKYIEYEVEEIYGDQKGNIENINRNAFENSSCNPIQNYDTNNYNSGETNFNNKNNNLRDSCLSKDTNKLIENNLEKSIDSSKLLMRTLQENQDNQNNNLYNSNNFYTNDGIQNSINNNFNKNNYYQNSNNINIQGSNNNNMNNYYYNNNQNSINNNINNNLNDKNMMNYSNRMEESHGGDFRIASDANIEIENNNNNKNMMNNNSNNNNMMNNSNNNNMMNNSNNNNMMNNSNNNNMMNNSNNNNMMNNNSNNNNFMNNNSSNNNMINNSNNFNSNEYNNSNNMNTQNSNNNNINYNYSQNNNNKNSLANNNLNEDIYTFKDDKISIYKNSFNMKFAPGVRQSVNNVDNRFINYDANSEYSLGNNMNNNFGKNTSVNNINNNMKDF